MVNKEMIMKELEKVVDPEVGIPITEMQLVDDIQVDNDGNVFLELHVTTPFCPPIFAFKIAQDAKELISKLEGIKTVKIKMTGHFMAEQINKQFG